MKKDKISIHNIYLDLDSKMKSNKARHRIRAARAMASPRMTQDDLVARMQAAGYNITKNMLSRIETGDRYVTDLELIGFAKVLNVSTTWLLEETNIPDRKRNTI